MSFDPEYGETPLPFEELDAILPAARESLAEPITKAVVYDLEHHLDEGIHTLVEVVELLLPIFMMVTSNKMHQTSR